MERESSVKTSIPRQDESIGKKSDDNFLVQPPTITLPKGGGAIKSIDEKFSVNAVNGTATVSIPLPTAEGREGVAPSLRLSYNSGSGNSEFGLGWSIQIPSISRKTDKGLPQYLDGQESDVFQVTGAEDLVPVLERNDDSWENKTPTHPAEHGVQYTVTFYRPRIEGSFARIEKWVNETNGDVHWRAISRDNILSVYGIDSESRIADPQDSSKVFKWLLSYTCDDKGNITRYIYKPEDFAGIEERVFERNKKNRCTNTYLKQVLYGNKTAFYRGDAVPDESDFMFRLVFDYGEHASEGLGFHTDIDHQIPADVYIPKNAWTYRKDAFSNCRAGFEIRTYRRCRRIMLFHCFEELRANAEPYLVKSMELVFDEQLMLEIPNDSLDGFSYLVKIIQKGHKLNSNGTTYDSRALPTFDFTYQQLEWNTEIHDVTAASAGHVPSPAEGPAYQWTDLYSEGIPGVMMEANGGWFYKFNLGNGQLTPPQLVAPKPSFSGLTNGILSIRDLAGNGKKYAVAFSGGQQGFFELSDEDEWKPFRPFSQLPVIDFADPNLKWIDLQGDGMPDLLLTEEDAFLWFPARGERGFETGVYAPKAKDEERGPTIVFADAVQSVYLADMTGDGLTDIVRIRNGEVCYWANLGYGRFSAKVTMENAPFFDHPENFNPAYLRLADIDGSGTTDIIYLGRKDLRVWNNLNGNAWREGPVIVNPFPDMHRAAEVSVTDFLGTGCACIVWSSPLPGDSPRPLKYIDLTQGKKPHLLIGWTNNLGKRTTIQYRSSTQFYLDDKKKGEPWVTKLAFPVQVVSQVEVWDDIARSRFVTTYSYHHGCYDHAEREFRGFARVDQLDTETYSNFVRADSGNITDESLHQAPVLTKTWFHTGAVIAKAEILKQFGHEYFNNTAFTEHHLPDAYVELPAGIKIEDLPAGEYAESFRALKGMMLRKEVYALDGSDNETIPYSVVEENGYIKMLQPRGKNKYAVFIPATSETITYHYERVPSDPRIKHDVNLEIDEFNNVVVNASVVYPRMINNPELPEELKQEIQQLPSTVKAAQAALHILVNENSYTNDVDTDTEYRVRSNAATRVWELTGAKPAGTYFTAQDLKDFVNAAEEIKFTDVANPTKVQKRILSHERTLYIGDDAVTPLAYKEQHSKGIPYESYRLAFTSTLLNSLYSGKVDNALLTAGQYRLSASLKPLFPASDPDDEWWIPSGTTGYPANPESHFFLPDRFINPYGKTTTAGLETKYHLYVPVLQDPIGNQTSVIAYDFRVLKPTAIKDANDNISEVRFDILGLVVGTAQKGKGNEADDFDGFVEDPDEATINNFFNDPHAHGAALLQHATGRIVYDIHHLPTSAATILRERHFQDVTNNGGPDRLQYSFEYSNGMGKVLMKKTETTPGNARFIDDAGQLQSIDTTPNPRWIGNGRTILNNKGKPVKEYQPYFSTTHRFEDDSRLVEVGPTNILFYDALGRLIRTELPNETFSKEIHGGWKQVSYDFNDTIVDSPWYNKRINRLIDAALIADGKDPILEQTAAAKAAKHHDTPLVTHLDTMARVICRVTHNRDQAMQDIYNVSSFDVDIKGNLKRVTDALGRIVMTYEYDVAGNIVEQVSFESGQRLMFNDAMNLPLRVWDARHHVFSFTYDDLQRPLATRVTGGDGAVPLNHLVGKTVYGEGQINDKQHNLRLRPYEVRDQSTVTRYTDYDLNGNPQAITKTFCKDHDITINWDGAVSLENDVYVSSMAYDALKRIVAATAPHVNGQPATSYYPTYNESGLLGAMEVSIRGGPRSPYVRKITYNEKSLRTAIQYGNNTTTAYTYDKETFRLLRLRTTRPAGVNGFGNGLFKDAAVLQDLLHTYDPMGNVTAIRDDALASVFFENDQIDPVNEYEYDALYQLIEATGRKHAGQTDIQHTQNNFNYRNHPFANSNLSDPNDATAFRNYREIYTYDKVGNMEEQQHVSKNSSWTRTFEYGNNNQLTKTSVGLSFSALYNYDAHGNCKAMEHLNLMEWNFVDALCHVDLGGGGDAYYNYDGEGNRTRKVIIRPDGKRVERYYIGGFEIYRERNGAGQIVLQRETLHISDDHQRIAMAETEIANGADGSTLVRYQYGNHVSSAALELDESPGVSRRCP
ncbi:MAG: SpvB/TcaC N-terminal domain-containing protein [Bacteroidota bacterium]